MLSVFHLQPYQVVQPVCTHSRTRSPQGIWIANYQALPYDPVTFSPVDLTAAGELRVGRTIFLPTCGHRGTLLGAPHWGSLTIMRDGGTEGRMPGERPPRLAPAQDFLCFLLDLSRSQRLTRTKPVSVGMIWLLTGN